MMKHCPYHEDSTPSVKVYSDAAWCFGGCGLITLDKLGIKPEEVEKEEKYVEDLERSIQRIKSLPTGAYRGFCLPYDHFGYYLVWGDGSYYKQRSFKGTPKYRGPSGHSPPPFWVRQGTSDTLLVVEGEFDALSAALAMPEFDVVSPGSASNFGSKALLTHLKPYSTIMIVSDDDKAGLAAAINLGALIYEGLPGVPFKKIFKSSSDKDFNDLLVEFGKEHLREEILKLLAGVQRPNHK